MRLLCFVDHSCLKITVILCTEIACLPCLLYTILSINNAYMKCTLVDTLLNIENIEKCFSAGLPKVGLIFVRLNAILNIRIVNY